MIVADKFDIMNADDQTYKRVVNQVKRHIKEFVDLDPTYMDEEEQARVPKNKDITHMLYYGTDSDDSDFAL